MNETVDLTEYLSPMLKQLGVGTIQRLGSKGTMPSILFPFFVVDLVPPDAGGRLWHLRVPTSEGPTLLANDILLEQSRFWMDIVRVSKPVTMPNLAHMMVGVER